MATGISECLEVIDGAGDIADGILADFAFDGEVAVVADIAEVLDVVRPVDPTAAEGNLKAFAIGLH